MRTSGTRGSPSSTPAWDGVILRLMIRKIIAGGQEGAQRAALDWAIWHGIDHGGWCPHGRRAADGKLDERYQLEETPAYQYSESTEHNVEGSDGTVIFTIGHDVLGAGKEASGYCGVHEKPWLHVSGTGYETAQTLIDFVEGNRIAVLHVTGSRESQEPGIYQFVEDALNEAFAPEKRA